MEKPLFECTFGFKLLGTKPEMIQVFEDRIIHSKKVLLEKSEVIFLDQIAGIDAFTTAHSKIEIKTNDGRSRMMHVWPKDKEQLLAAIYQAKQKNKKG